MDQYIPGFVQGFTRVLISYPFDYIKTHMQINGHHAKDIVRNVGFTGLYRGVSIPLCSVSMERAIQFKFYEQFNKKYNPYVSGIYCGSISSFLFLPFNNINNNYILTKKSYAEIIKSKGNIINFYNGILPDICRASLSSCIYLGVYGDMRRRYGNGDIQSMINSIVACMTLWTVVYPFDTIKVEQQVSGISMIDVLRKRKSTLWRGISMTYLRTIPSSAVGMLVYERIRVIIEGTK